MGSTSRIVSLLLILSRRVTSDFEEFFDRSNSKTIQSGSFWRMLKKFSFHRNRRSGFEEIRNSKFFNHNHYPQRHSGFPDSTNFSFALNIPSKIISLENIYFLY